MSALQIAIKLTKVGTTRATYSPVWRRQREETL